MNTPVGKYSFFNNILLNSKLESNEIQIKMNEKQEIVFIFDKIKKVYLYPSLNQKIIRYREDYIYKFKHVYFNCQYYNTYTQSYKHIEAIHINFMDNQDYITYKMDEVLIKDYVYGFGIFKIIDKTGNNIFYFNVSNEDRDMFEHIIPEDYETNVSKIVHDYKYDIKVKLLNIAKNEYEDDLITELKEYIFYYLNKYSNNHIDGVASDMPPELKFEYMYDYICSAIDEIIECKTEEVLNYNLKLIYKLIEDDDVRFDFEDSSNIYYGEYM